MCYYRCDLYGSFWYCVLASYIHYQRWHCDTTNLGHIVISVNGLEQCHCGLLVAGSAQLVYYVNCSVEQLQGRVQWRLYLELVEQFKLSPCH